VIKQGEVKKYLTPKFWTAYNLWAKIKRYGWPHGSAWADEPAAVVELVELFDAELDLLKEKDREKDAGKGRTAGAG
jgi:hypothetical protein